MLRDDPNGRDSQGRYVLDPAVGQDGPYAFLDHIRHFLLEEIFNFVSRLVRPPEDGGVFAVEVPGGGLEDHWRTS